MDWTTFIITLLGGTSILGIVDAIRYRKKNERLKESETRNAETETQSQQMDLAEKYLEKVLSLTEKGSNTSESILARLDAVHADVVNVNDRVIDCRNDISSIVRYLNGGYQSFLKGESDCDSCKGGER